MPYELMEKVSIPKDDLLLFALFMHFAVLESATGRGYCLGEAGHPIGYLAKNRRKAEGDPDRLAATKEIGIYREIK